MLRSGPKCEGRNISTAAEIERFSAGVNALLARHDSHRDAQSFARYKGKPLEFMRVELGFEPYPKQIEMVEAFERDRRTVVRGNHGAGKDAILAPLMLYAAYVKGMLVLAISATEKQLLGQLWRELTNRFSDRLPGELFTADLRIGGEKRIIAMTSGSVSNLTGWHDPGGVFVAISESQSEQVEAAAFDAAIANAVDDASRIMVVGNPIKPEGRFYEASKKSTWRAIQISALDHPNVQEGRVVIPGGPAPTWPAEMAAEFGTDSPWYISRVLGEFPASGSVDSLVKPAWFDAANERHDRGKLVLHPLPVVALDVARSLDRDESVAAVAQLTRLDALFTWRSRNLVDTADRFLVVAERARMSSYLMRRGKALDPESLIRDNADKLAEWLNTVGAPPLDLIIDAPGIGSGCIDEVRRRKRSVVEYWGWLPAKDEKRYANLRAEVYWNLRTILQNDTGELPRDASLREEALAMEWSEDNKGRIVMIGKDELRKAIKRSPDRLDAGTIALAFARGLVRVPLVTVGTYDPY